MGVALSFYPGASMMDISGKGMSYSFDLGPAGSYGVSKSLPSGPAGVTAGFGKFGIGQIWGMTPIPNYTGVLPLRLHF